MHGNGQEQEWDAFVPGTVPQPAVPAYGPPPGYGPPGYGPPGYGPPGYGPQGYSPPPGYGYPYPPVPWAVGPLAWPDGPRRPGTATAAAVLGFVTAGLTVLFCLFFIVFAFAGEDDEPTRVLLLGLISAAGLIVGGVRLLDRRSPAVLFGSALASVAVLLLALLAGALTIDRTSGLDSIVMFVVLAAPLPILTAVFAWQSRVRGWAAARP